MKRVVILFSLFAPALALVFFTLQPRADIAANLPLFHFYVVTFTTFSAAVVSIMIGQTLGDQAKPRHVLAATAFAVMGAIFFTHGLATPNALIDHVHPAISWSAWLTLFSGGALFAVASFDRIDGAVNKLPVRAVVHATTAAVLAYFAIAAFAPTWLSQLQTQFDSPTIKDVTFIASLVLWLVAAARFGQIWLRTRNRMDGTLGFVSFWLAIAAVSMHRYPVWNLSWWMYHLILLAGFLISVLVLALEYEQARQFRLVRYYLAASLIITAFLALITSALFTQFSYNALVGELRQSADAMADNLAGGLPGVAAPADLQNLSNRPDVRAVFNSRLEALPIKELIVYDGGGVAVYSSEAEWLGVNVEDRATFAAALNGETVTRIHPPGSPPATYQPARPVYTLETFAPLRPENQTGGQPIGVVVTAQDAPELGRSILNARLTGLLTAAVTMGLLFAALLSVVGRADRIITARNQELATAYANLRRAEAMRDDLTSMIIHDLRSPLTAIASSLEILPRFLNSETRIRVINSAQAANRRMTGMIDDLLTVSKIEAGELKPNQQTTLLEPLFNERLEAYAPQAAKEEKTLNLSCPPGLSANIDSALISRVLDNLLSNAFKYTERSGHIQVLACDDNNGRAFITVRDDGEGIPDEHKARIFDKYVQAPNANGAAARKGSGLGLTFCRLVVESHGGQIWVQDAPGGGSEFSFWLPKEK